MSDLGVFDARSITRKFAERGFEYVTDLLVERHLSHSTGVPIEASPVAVISAFARNNGISQGAHLQVRALIRNGYAAQALDTSKSLRSLRWKAPTLDARTFVVHCGAPQTRFHVRAVLPAVRDAHRVGFWAWELPSPPQSWKNAAKHIDSIWTPSRFSEQSLRRMFEMPIRVVPHVVEIPRSARGRAGSKTGPFSILCMADSRSSLTRKNPHGAIKAFQMAFGPDQEDVQLTVKVSGSTQYLDQIIDSVSAWPNIRFLRARLTQSEMASLFEDTDLFLSLHRSEGFGLPMLEAMSYGIPVVATNWSGNTDYMTEENSAPVPFSLVQVKDDFGMYSDGVWAEPDLSAAAERIRMLCTDSRLYSDISYAARQSAIAWSSANYFSFLGSSRDQP